MLSIADIAQFAEEHAEALRKNVVEFAVGKGPRLRFSSSKAIMGVINFSSDSWYRESVCLNQEMAVQRLELLSAQGADIVDVGAESTLPSADRVSGRSQLNQLLPVIKEAKKRSISLSVETYLPSVAAKCLAAGAAVINFTGSRSRKILEHVAEHDAAVILCYVQGSNIRDVDKLEFENDPIAVMHDYFSRQIDVATKIGVSKIFIDPGLGFYYSNLRDSADRVRFQMKTFLQTFRLRSLGFPVCHALPHAFEYFGDEVRSAEPFFAVLASLGGTDLFRTHEVARTKAVLDTLSVY